jgi:putative colanic acid biosysnthesis UDP-glucose lipid carrier transferase
VLVDKGGSSRGQLGGFIGALADAEDVVRREAVDDVIVAVPWSQPERLAACLDVFKPLTVDVHLFPDDATPFVVGGTDLVAGVPLARLRNRPLVGVAAALKAMEDRLLGAILLVLAAPVLLAVAVAIKLDSPGPVLFRQKRCGYDNQPFTCLKFRSMRARPKDAPEEEIVTQATREDARITRVGRFIRRTSLDELPQLFNVVGGSMSLVGPRPHALSHHDTYSQLVDDYRCRHRMKPGITGWAQVNGYRGETATVDLMRKRVLHDLWYIDHWSLGLDLAILARTPLACLKGTNAY